MSLKQIRLELARTKDYPEGSSSHGYEFVAPLDDDGQLNFDEWSKYNQVCTVRRFWDGEDDEHGLLLRTRGRRWMFSYEPGDEDDEPIFKFDRHSFVVGEYMSITEHDGIARPFRIVSIDAAPVTRA
ncbi:MAG: hypothetical protein GY791_20140 [Alphaproteobacteria bacterium]|nr:hypothetical protein [Alphaproteobacteria bacterium]